ncbi:23S rRNA (pseudouridine(1915)-N(3))-methyltransferase RlmH [Hufsiella ginkgonis]|uniref:Ribosomal RNA large subunit methyltransferase H n=1 Tax=Hufsiella ginkgonis TaxID=2695274 RepID=A0A7K1Y310_9SPHI|nr:23S rRNA (pseudouridine(1915)-N(3))-methyltransferase RlmH [Hufsiella ginkgonis]MXV17488.1 23S rRNA (pseudouridine(1915)-N(3))-methyltransferase RlmH [Hufsiella ginkgonis]
MKITLLVTGKTEDNYLKEGMEKYLKRLKLYVSFRVQELPELKSTKNLTESQQKIAEAELISKHLSPADHLVLLDEHGQDLSSVGFSGLLQKKMLANVQHLVFVVGGPYGFDNSLHRRAAEKLSLSKMTFSHQMVRLFFIEQLYRAFTILKGEPYHHK